MDVTKPYKFIGFGAMDVTRPCEFIGFGAMNDTKPYEFVGLGSILGARTKDFASRGPRNLRSRSTSPPKKETLSVVRRWNSGQQLVGNQGVHE
jgi:hypothetical protein